MAASGILSVTSHKKRRSIRSALASALLEWLLIFLLFVDAIFSHLIIKFSCYCELQAPCLLCSRLDHILGNKKFKHYWDLICSKHKLEVSSLVLCHAHNKLVDVHGMCETCLFSFATINKSNAETYRLLVGKLGEDSCFDLNEDPLLEEHVPSTRLCSCCNAPWVPKGYSRNLMQMTIIRSEAAYDQDKLTKIEQARSVNSGHQRISSQSDHLSHIRYTELQVNSDTESEVLFSDDADNDANTRSHKINHKEDFGIRRVQMEPRGIMLPDDLSFEKLIDPDTELRPPVSVSQVQSDSFESHSVPFTSPKVAMDNGLEELNWQQADDKYVPSAYPELISLGNVPPSSIAEETPIEASTESKHSSLVDDIPSSLDAKQTLVEELKHSLVDDVSSSFDAKQTLVEVSKDSINISVQDAPSSSVEASERRELISVDDVLIVDAIDDVLFVDAKEMLVEESTETRLASVNEVPSSSFSREASAETSEMSKLISVDEDLPSSDSKEAPHQTSTTSKLVSLVDVLQSTEIETPVQGLKESYISRNEELWQTAKADSETCKTRTTAPTMTETASERNPVSGVNGQQVPNLLDLGDAYKLAVGSRGRQLSGVLAEQWIGKDSSRISDDLKLLLSQLSTAREQSINDLSPRVSISPGVSPSPKFSANNEELKNPDAPSVVGMQKLQKRISFEKNALERNESGQSLDGSIVSEIEGENVVDRLTRQIEHDKKLLSSLYKELEEERNASSVAVNQAMAMITRLQEEKATLQMEALQCIRMMEEQAEYDIEALQKTNDLLTEREKEIQDLEAELEYYRVKYPDESFLEDTVEPLSDMKTEDVRENLEANSVSTSKLTNSATEKPDASHEVEERNMSSGGKKTITVKNSLLDIEDERSYILRSLKKLENKLSLYPNFQLDLANNEYSGNGPAQDHSLSVETSELIGTENNEVFYSPLLPNLDTIASEVSDLSERLKALEADKNFVEHCINSVSKGEEGLHFIQEIASHLKELRKIAERKGE